MRLDQPANATVLKHHQ